jgi:hypothetical protein
LAVVLAAGLGAILLFIWRAAEARGRTLGWKLGWVLALAMAGVLAAPVFWFVHVWREAPPDGAAPALG